MAISLKADRDTDTVLNIKTNKLKSRGGTANI